ncbi:outer membrane lipoprotein carrier protein LolA [uncultured Umboniibacter sp.]|uniref:LolA family protein n=1 Tax=uncultured Umboniibacter sp. TaxID=1798917 RepID=UPI00262A516C|nr:outer membrane lipoprotein carrier protein LolA [uncultured Umboniibacter sp.]
MISWLIKVIFSLAVLMSFVLQLATADEALDRVKARLSENTQSSGLFQQTKIISSLSQPLKSSGSFLFEPHRGVIWLTQAPFLSQQCWTSESVATASASYWVRAIFAGDFEQLSAFFEITANWSQEGWRVKLVPLNEAVAAILTAVEVSGSQHVERISYQETGGHSTEINLTPLDVRPDIDWANCP